MTTQQLSISRNSPYISPLRYPGAKRRLYGYIKQALEINNLKPSLYVEPFAGGASIALQLLHEHMVEKVILMDLDPWIASFWQTVFFDTDWLVDQIRSIEVTLEKWWEIKRSIPLTTRDNAIKGFFLNRTNFSGILEEHAGPIGGKNQKSAYKIDCRFKREVLIDRVNYISSFRNKVHGVWCASWDAGLQRVRSEQADGLLPNSNLFIYLDPPFFEEAEALYRFFFSEEDHIKLRNFLLELTDKFILSYDSATQVEALYGNAIKNRTNGTNQHHIELLYSLAKISERKRGKEVIISNLSKLPIDKATSAENRPG